MKLSPHEITTLGAYEEHGEAWAEARGNAIYYPDQIKRFQELLPSGKILDIGSGTGRDAELLSQVGYECTGIDISDKLLEIARARLPQVNFVKQSIYELNFPDRFDGFWAAAILVHIPKSRLPEALTSIKSVIKDGAIGFMNVKDVSQGIEDEVEEYELSPGKVMKRYYSYWGKEEFEWSLEQAGFVPIDYYYRSVADAHMWHCYFVKNFEGK